MKSYSRPFVLFTFLALVFIYLVFVAGSLVRITGSGMGCPDWPTCFGRWIPPTERSQLPDDYREIYAEKRAQKMDKFTRLLDKMGFKETADQLRSDPSMYEEEAFNAQKTWTEYANRLVGFIAGNLLLFQFLIFLFYYKRRPLILWSLLNLVLIGITAWIGSVVVASNLTPWTITVHMFLGLAIIAIQLLIFYRVSPKMQVAIRLPRYFRVLVILCFMITTYQVFLGTQVRESIDALTSDGYGRESWTSMLGLPFLVHRSFSWLVLAIVLALAFINERQFRIPAIRWTFIVLTAALLTGVMLAHLNMPGLVQTIHLISATVLFGILYIFLLRTRKLPQAPVNLA